MTYFDLSTLIEEQLHGGHAQAEHYEQALKNAGIACPCRVHCVRYGSAAKPQFSNDALVIDCHPGLLYLISSNALPRLPKSMIHCSLTCASASDVLFQLRNAVIEQRRLLIHSHGIDADASITWQQELQARNTLHESIRQQSPDWNTHAQQWWHIIMVRHMHMLLELRRKIYDCASILSAEIDKHWHFPDAPSHLYARIHQCFDYDALGHLCMTILNNIGQAIAKQNQQFNPEHLIKHNHSTIVQNAYAFAMDHYQENVSLQDAADSIHVSAAHLARLCKKELGMTYVHLLQSLRLHHARERLQSSEDSVLQIALDSGFQSVKHFHRVFLKWVELTPQQFRKHHHHI